MEEHHCHRALDSLDAFFEQCIQEWAEEEKAEQARKELASERIAKQAKVQAETANQIQTEVAANQKQTKVQEKPLTEEELGAMIE